ncbi:UNVERIFIED_CONTAM: hypothetical protein GTU68_058329 [Idotea baltica]|nr:hypothetical protein [Idotea baltica]
MVWVNTRGAIRHLPNIFALVILPLWRWIMWGTVSHLGAECILIVLMIL